MIEKQKELQALEVTLTAIQGQAAALGMQGISDSRLRHEYNRKAQAFVNEISFATAV